MGCTSSKPQEKKPVEEKKPATVIEKVEEAVIEEVETCLCWEPCLYPEYCDECSCPCGRAGTCIALCVHKATGAAAYDIVCFDCGKIGDDCSSALTATTKKEREAANKKAAEEAKKTARKKSVAPKK